jgi:hypothetical protein
VRPLLAPLALALALAGCGGSAGTTGQTHHAALVPTGGGSLASIEVRTLAERPRLTLVSRDGDPAPAIAVAFATDLGPAATAALSAVVEARLREAGFEPQVHVDRSAFRVAWLAPDATRSPKPFFEALARAMREPVAPKSPELTLAGKRIVALRQSPLDAPELSAVAACTGRLGIDAGEPSTDPRAPSFAGEVEAHRRAALHSGRASIAAVGPADFCLAAAKALEGTEGWPAGEPPKDPFPTADAIGAYTAPVTSGRRGKVTVAVRLGDALGAVAAAERLAAPGSPLRERLGALPQPFRTVEVVGAARPRGGCVSVTLEPDPPSPSASLERDAARAAAVARHEIRLESTGAGKAALAQRQILSASDPREAAERAAWWAMSTSVPGAPARSAVALGVPPPPGPDPGPARQGNTFSAELERALASTSAPVAERRVSIERGQGEVWALVASSCGVAEEGASDAGSTALALMAAVAARRGGDVTLEPWLGPDGAGILAHAAPRDERETPAELARRVAGTAARALRSTELTTNALSEARASSLAHIERASGRGGIAFEALSAALAPDHPSWLDPFGPFTRVSGTSLAAAQARLRALSEGPIRLAFLANADAAQAAEAALAVDRWLVPRVGERACYASAPGSPRAGSFAATLPRDAALAQALVAAPVPPVGASGHELALVTALALGGEGGLLDGALPAAGGARASARVTGTGRAAALVIDVRAPADLLAGAVSDVRTLLTRLAGSGLPASDIARAVALASRRDGEARADPRRRLIQLWSGRSTPVHGAPAPPALATFLATTLNESSLVIIEARPE